MLSRRTTLSFETAGSKIRRQSSERANTGDSLILLAPEVFDALIVAGPHAKNRMTASLLKSPARSVFLSHNGRHKPWVRRVAAQWRALGLKVFFDEDSIAPGENLVQALERGICESRHVVLILSPASQASPWVAMELAMTQVQDPAAADRRLIPVLVESMNLETIRPSLRFLNIVDLTDEQSRDERYRSLLSTLLGGSPTELPPPPPLDFPAEWRTPVDSRGIDPPETSPNCTVVAAGQVGLELTITGNLDEFSPELQTRLFRAIQALLETTGEIRVRSIRPGSIILTLDMTAEEAERLYFAVLRGALQEFGVKSARVIRAAPMPSPNRSRTLLPPTERKEPEDRTAANRSSLVLPPPHGEIQQRRAFIESLRDRLIAEKGLHDLSRNAEFASFPLIGFHRSPVSMDFVACRMADGLTESQIVSLRDEFFDVVQHAVREYGLAPRGPNPNGLLAFVFQEGCSEGMMRFIRKQTRISHRAATGAVTVSWAIDLAHRRIHVHQNPVSVIPPVRVVPQTVFPGLRWLESLVTDLPNDAVLEDSHPREPAAPAPALARPFPERIRILFLGANSASRPLDLEREVACIQQDLRMARERDVLEFRQVWAVTRDTLMQAMLDESPTIVHFAGHGETGGILLRDEGGNPRLMTGDALSSLFALFRDTVTCVVLNACWSEAQARAIRRHVPYVIGTRADIPDQAALAFSAGFYKAIGAGKDVPFAFEIGKTSARVEGGGGEGLLILL